MPRKNELKSHEELGKKQKHHAMKEAKLTRRKNASKKMAICTTRDEDKCFTHSAFIFDTKNIKAYYCQGNPLEKPFKKYTFSRVI